MPTLVSSKVVGKFQKKIDCPVSFGFSRHHVTITVGDLEIAMETTITRREWDLVVQTGQLWIPKSGNEGD